MNPIPGTRSAIYQLEKRAIKSEVSSLKSLLSSVYTVDYLGSSLLIESFGGDELKSPSIECRFRFNPNKKPLILEAPHNYVRFEIWRTLGCYVVTTFFKAEPLSFFQLFFSFDEYGLYTDNLSKNPRFEIWDFSPCFLGKAPINVLGKAIKGYPASFTEEVFLYTDLSNKLQFVDFTGFLKKQTLCCEKEGN